MQEDHAPGTQPPADQPSVAPPPPPEPPPAPFAPPAVGAQPPAQAPVLVTPAQQATSAVAPAEAPKKRKTWLIVVIVLLLSCCLIGGGIAALVGWGVSESIKVSDAVSEADIHMDRASDIIVQAMDEADFDDVDDSVRPEDHMREVVDSIRSSMDEARDALEDARGVIEPLPEGDAKTAYLAYIAEVDDGIDAFDEVLTVLTDSATLVQAVSDAADLADEGRKALNTAIDKMNSRSWDGAASDALASQQKYEAARDAFAEVHEREASLGFDEVSTYFGSHVEEARITVEMAGFGKAGKTDEFNRAIDRVDSLRESRGSMPDAEAFSSGDWIDMLMSDALGRFEGHMDEADRLRERVNEFL